MGTEDPGLDQPPHRQVSIVSIPQPLYANSYQRLLYEQLWRYGIGLLPGSPFAIGWLRRNRRSPTIVHVHWPYFGYVPDVKATGLRGGWHRWLAVARFGIRLAVARAFGYRVIWTVHEVFPPDARGHSHRVAAGLLALASNKLIVHDEPTMEACRRLPTAAGKLALIPHASYEGVYPRGRPGAQVRRDLGLSWARFVFLCFGLIRPYKELPLLLEAFRQTGLELPDVALVIAGQPLEEALAGEIEEAAQSDPRIKAILRFVLDWEVAELFAAADACVYPRGDGGTAGTLLLSLSLDTPVVAARTPAYRELLGEDTAGWLFAPHDAESLRETLIRAADPGSAAVRGMHAGERIAGRDWVEIGRRTAELLLAD